MRASIQTSSFINSVRLHTLIVHGKKSFREVEKITNIPKSTLQRSFQRIEREVNSAEERYKSGHDRLALVDFVLNNVFLGGGSVRKTALMLESAFGVPICHQTLLQILEKAGEIAIEKNKKLPLNFIQSGLFDEIFMGQSPILVLIDSKSGLAYARASVDRTAESWGCFLEDLKLQGLNPTSVTTDGGSGLLSALDKAFPDTPQIRDLFHVIHKVGKGINIIEGHCLTMLNFLYTRGGDASFQQKCDDAVRMFDSIECSFKAFKNTMFLADKTGSGQYTTAEGVKSALLELAELLEFFFKNFKRHKKISAAFTYLLNGIKSIMAYKDLIEKKVLEVFGKEKVDLVLTAIMPIVECMAEYQRATESRAKQSERAARFNAMKAELIDTGTMTLAEFDYFFGKASLLYLSGSKSNSYVESLNSVIRSHLQTFKSIPRWFCELFTYFWNNRTTQRCKTPGIAHKDSYLGKSTTKDSWTKEILADFPLNTLRCGLPPFHSLGHH